MGTLRRLLDPLLAAWKTDLAFRQDSFANKEAGIAGISCSMMVEWSNCFVVCLSEPLMYSSLSLPSLQLELVLLGFVWELAKLRP